MNALIYNDDGASDGKNFLIVYNVTAGETYYIGTKAFSSSTVGNATLLLSGDATVADGGYAITTTGKSTVTYGASFTLALPESRPGSSFIG